MARYVDGFVLPVPRRMAATYRRLAQRAPMPFDARRMIYGGFQVAVDL
jgi:uncharacterized protein YbaA (DUF1428 family)